MPEQYYQLTLADAIAKYKGKDLSKLALAQSTCSEFNITVTFQEVQS